jgi:hypothetical protein
MQNKANFKKVKLNVTALLTNKYVQLDTWSIRKTKPIQSQLKPIQSQLKPFKANSNPIKAKQTQCLPAVCVAGLSAICVADQSQKMLLICTSLEVLENSIITGYHLEPTRPINHRRLT